MISKMEGLCKKNPLLHILLFVSALVLISCSHSSGRNRRYAVPNDEVTEKPSITIIGQPSSDSVPFNQAEILNSISDICKPVPLLSVSEQIIQKKAYIVSYNKDTKQPNWVAWHLTREHTDGAVRRGKMFYEEESVPIPRATLQDYKGSRWSRGHMCPAGDNKWDEEAMTESFSLVNVCPQDASLNSGLWNRVEIDCRQWARKFGDVYIVCGPLFLNREHITIGPNKVFVPEAFFKVILCLQGEPKAIGYIVRNNDGKKKKDSFVNTVDNVERITGMDFFPALPDSIENKVEAHSNLEAWR